ncbi:MAG TPA: hypothetical protein VHF70_04040, partial [Rubrobacteraceae bacterium]|nr:hypothetical protein [Rubrobacteraceae bacterium]
LSAAYLTTPRIADSVEVSKRKSKEGGTVSEARAIVDPEKILSYWFLPDYDADSCDLQGLLGSCRTRIRT